MNRPSSTHQLGQKKDRVVMPVVALLVAGAGLCHEPSAAQPMPVAKAEQRRVVTSYLAEGTIEALRQSSLSAPIAARLISLQVQAGDPVRAGQVLAVLDDRELTQSVSANQAQLAQAQAQLTQAKAHAERTRSLAAQNFVSRAVLDEALAQLRSAQAGVEALRADVSRTQASRSNTRIAAPYDGLVSETHVQVGDVVTPGKPVLTVYAGAGLRVIAYLPQTQVAAVRQYGAAQVQLGQGKWNEAARVNVLPAADPVSHSTEVRVDLAPGASGMVPGQSARVRFKTGEAERLVVPQESVVRRSELTAVYVQISGGAFLQRLVRLGDDFGASGVEVLAGLSAGEAVALEPVRAGMALGKSPAVASGEDAPPHVKP
jgi:RND family efflux transporter MFP subunit